MIHLHKLFWPQQTKMCLEEKIKEQWFHENNTSPAGQHRDGLVLLLQPVEKGKLNFEAEEWIQ